MAKKKLGDNMLFQSMEIEDIEKERAELGITPEKVRPGAPRNDALIRKRGVQQGLPEDLTRTTIILPVELVNKMKDYSYTERITIKEAYTRAVEAFLKDKTDLLNHEDKK